MRDVLVATLEHLRRLEGDAPELRSIQLRTLTNGVVGYEKNGIITIDHDSRYFRDAQRGDYLPLSLVLFHEQQHQNGADERTAYLASIAFLKRHDAPQPLITSVIETALRIFAAPTTKEHHMKTFVPRINENGRPCCTSETGLCPACVAHHQRAKLALNASYTAPDPYESGILKMRGASVAMNDDERTSLGLYADGVAKMRAASR